MSQADQSGNPAPETAPPAEAARPGFLRRRWPLLLAALVLLLAVGALAGRSLLLAHRADPEGKDRLVVVAPGSGLKQASLLLAQAGVVDHPRLWLLAAHLVDWRLTIQAGEYQLSPAMTYASLVEALSQGKVVRHLVLVPEGFTLGQTIERLAEEGIVSPERAGRLARDPGFISSLGIEADSLEGYLFPETYRFVRGVGARRAFRAMVDHFKRQWEHLAQPAREAGLTRRQAVILASIIEAEAVVSEERPLISAVYHNRLKKGMLLQADPTVAYGLFGRNLPLTAADLKKAHAYNTYLNPGLPPGPICSPGLESLRAAVRPAASQDLYFVAKGDGSHVFNRSYQQHRRAVARYRRLQNGR